MDPTANLLEQRRCADRILATDDPVKKAGLGIRLAELVQALDGWIVGGDAMAEYDRG